MIGVFSFEDERPAPRFTWPINHALGERRHSPFSRRSSPRLTVMSRLRARKRGENRTALLISGKRCSVACVKDVNGLKTPLTDRSQARRGLGTTWAAGPAATGAPGRRARRALLECRAMTLVGRGHHVWHGRGRSPSVLGWLVGEGGAVASLPSVAVTVDVKS